MPNDGDESGRLAERVTAAAAEGTPLAVTGAGTRRDLGRVIEAEPLVVAGHRGIIAYEPMELVLTARAGTPLAEIEAALAERGQMLPFEPPHLGPGATLGGAVATGLAGPRRPWAGAVRDFVLGVRVINGRGEVLSFGGQVMKNVAGYDMSRLMAGSWGTLAVILDVSLKVLPAPAISVTRVFDLDAKRALARVNEWAGRPVPLSAACHDGSRLMVRLSGTAGGVATACERLGGETVDASDAWWADLREQRLPFFAGEAPLWRLGVPPATPPLDLEGSTLVDWGGAQRWLREGEPARIRAVAVAAGGHATLFRGGDRAGEIFHPLPAGLLALHRRLKAALDPAGILGPGRMYRDL